MSLLVGTLLLGTTTTGVVAAAAATAAATGPAPYDMKLTILTDEQGKDKGARCLDGTNPGFYHRAAPAMSSTDPTQANPHANSWVVYFKVSRPPAASSGCANQPTNQPTCR